MVVRLAMQRRAGAHFRSRRHAAILIAGIILLPGIARAQSGGPSLLLPGAASSIAPTTYGHAAAAIGSPDPVLLFALGGSALGPMAQTPGTDPAATALVYGTVNADAEEFGGGGGGGGEPVPILQGAPGGIEAICSDGQLAARLQAGGNSWTERGARTSPAQFPPGVFAETSADAIPDYLAAPTTGPSGDRSNLAPQGPAGGWCRPLAVPFAQSSPLASRGFWIPFIIVLAGFVVFWLSRGVRMPAA
jgi:hypothetical protein